MYVGIEMALQSVHIPKHLMFALLNLARYMDMQDRRLPLDVKLLATRAHDANMFAKCLRYRELEYTSKNVLPSKECIEDLITVGNELGLPDRAMGVLHHVMSDHLHISIEPIWLEKLNLWEEAKEAYLQVICPCIILCLSSIVMFEQARNTWTATHPDDNMFIHSGWMSNELGLLRCLTSLGEYEQVLAVAKPLHAQIKTVEAEIESNESNKNYTAWMSEVMRMGAHSAWMLGTKSIIFELHF